MVIGNPFGIAEIRQLRSIIAVLSDENVLWFNVQMEEISSMTEFQSGCDFSRNPEHCSEVEGDVSVIYKAEEVPPFADSFHEDEGLIEPFKVDNVQGTHDIPMDWKKFESERFPLERVPLFRTLQVDHFDGNGAT
jgi:hypothetical protein